MTVTNNPNSFRNGPDGTGHFGDYGGRYVAETLMPLILNWTRPMRRCQGRPQLSGGTGLLPA